MRADEQPGPLGEVHAEGRLTMFADRGAIGRRRVRCRAGYDEASWRRAFSTAVRAKRKSWIGPFYSSRQEARRLPHALRTAASQFDASMSADGKTSRHNFSTHKY